MITFSKTQKERHYLFNAPEHPALKHTDDDKVLQVFLLFMLSVFPSWLY